MQFKQIRNKFEWNSWIALYLAIAGLCSACNPTTHSTPLSASTYVSIQGTLGFSTIADAALSTTITSNTVVLRGFAGDLIASVTGPISALIVKGDLSGTSMSVRAGDSISLQVLSAPTPSTTLLPFFKVGGREAYWSVTTAQDTSPDAFSFSSVASAALSSEITSETKILTGFSGTLTASLAGSSSAYLVRNGITQGTSASVQAGDQLAIKMTSSADNSTAVTTSLALGTFTATWTVTTLVGGPPDTTPDAFSFNSQTGLNPTYTTTTGSGLSTPTLVQSNTVTLSGFNTPITATVTCPASGCAAILLKNGQSAGITASVVSGDQLAVRMLASGTGLTTSTATVTAGGVSGTFQATTAVSTVNRRFRVSATHDPSTTMTIGWESVAAASAASATVYYSTTDYGTDLGDWITHGLAQTPTAFDNSAFSMKTGLAKLTGLTPNATYYFMVADASGRSSRYWFKTLPSDPSIKLSLIEGGDTRTNPTQRRNGNSMVKKMRPHLAVLGGDYCNSGTDAEWAEWLDDWFQVTLGDDNRLIPVEHSKGNHESSFTPFTVLFGVPCVVPGGGPDGCFYRLTPSSGLFNLYALDTEISMSASGYDPATATYTSGSNQTMWLAPELNAQWSSAWWNIVQYHRSMRPTTHNKADGVDQYAYWAPLFRTAADGQRVELVLESDSHLAKYTWPIKYDPSAPDGLARDQNEGTTYIGEGGWGAPLVPVNWFRHFTRDAAAFYQVHWIIMEQKKLQIRTLLTDTVSSVAQISDSDLFTAPSGLQIWSPSNGAVVTVSHRSAPIVDLTTPTHGTNVATPQTIVLSATATAKTGSIAQVEFFANGVSVGVDAGFPYSVNWAIPAAGNYAITVVATDDRGYQRTSLTSEIVVGSTVTTLDIPIVAGEDDAEEDKDGNMNLTSSDLEMALDATLQTIGMRFINVTVPKGATIITASIQFESKEAANQNGTVNLAIVGEAADNASTYTTAGSNLTAYNPFTGIGRATTSAKVGWKPPAWGSADLRGADQRSPELKSIVSEIINRAGWVSGNAMAFKVMGSGVRTAKTWNFNSSTTCSAPSSHVCVPVLHIEYSN